MGTGASLPNNFKSQEPPPLPPPFYTGNPAESGISRISGSSCESQNDERRTSGTSTTTLGNPGFQHPRSLGSVKNEEWWHQRPSAPSLSSLRPQQETLLTYAAQMTGWQSGCESAVVPSMHQEAMELSRTVSHLAAANQQLASAHTILLGQLESLYLELNRERQLRFEREHEASNATRQNSNSYCTNDQEKLIIDRTIGNLEATINERSRPVCCESVVSDERSRQVRKNCLTKEIGVQSQNHEDELEIRLSAGSGLETKNSHRFGRRENFEKTSNNERDELIENETDLSLEYKKAVDRIQSLENELAISHVNVIDCKREESERDRTKKKKKKDDERFVQGYENIETRSRNESKNLNNEKETRRLLQEIERLNDERLKYREKNEKLGNNLENQVRLVEKLRTDYKISRSQYENIEMSLNEGKQQFDALMVKYENAKLEKSRLSEELQVAKLDRDNANERIINTEKELADSILAKKEIAQSENQESSRLRKILSDEMRNKREQDRALEESLKEIQRLNEMIENAKTDQEVGGGIEILENESSPEEAVLDPEIAVSRSSNMEEFRKELSLKREARQRAIAAVSSEMDRLRRELDAEKEAHSETSRVLDLLKSGQAATNVITKQEIIGGETTSGKNEDLPEKSDWRTIMKPDPELSSNEADAQALTDILKVSDELRSSIRLQTEKIDDLRYHLECEPEGHRNRITSLKEIATASREASGIRERQINKLKNLLAQILARLGDPRFRVEISDDVRAEHDRQLEDIRRLKTLYDDRLRVLADLRDSASKELNQVKEKLKGSQKDNFALEEDLKKAEEKIDTQDTEISNLESQLGLTKADCRDLQNQMSVINGLFTQMLLSASSADMDLDRLTRLLQENHDLISDMAREEGSEAAALPKLLLDLVEQVEGRGGSSKIGNDENEKKDDGPQEENIAHNLPKVWRVLLELLSCHAVGGSPPVTPASLSTDPNSCYKSVDTPSGPRLVISVSKTYIRLKELILEKKHLEKEMNRMKQLNTHLESKLGEQEKRLSTVSSELSKTWNVVGRMQAQHQQLHTHEKILRYELQQKRKMLQELKQELEYCREKWESARQKNTNTEIEWRSLRREFAARKSLAAQDSFNNSGESGFSDERGDDSDEEDEAVGERVRIGPRRRARKENPRAPTSDTESEQPTDTELSERTRDSTSATPPEQRTSLPAIVQANVSNAQDIPIASTSTDAAELETKSSNEDEITPIPNNKISPITLEDPEQVTPMNSVDRALANVIQNLITVDDESTNDVLDKSRIFLKKSENQDTKNIPSCLAQPEVDEKNVICNDRVDDSEQSSTIKRPVDEIQLSKMKCKDISSNDTDNNEQAPTTCAVSVFSIGPFPTSLTPPPVKSVQFSDPLIVGPSTQSAFPVFGDVVQQPPEDPTVAIKNEMVEEIDEKTRVEINEEITTISNEEAMSQQVSSCCGNSIKLAESERDLPEIAVCLSEDFATPSTSVAENLTEARAPKPVQSHEQVLAARATRLKRLEEQADWLMKKMNATSIRGSALSTRLEELHEVYGEAPVPPPMPDILPNVRIPSETTINHRQKKEETVEKGHNETAPPDSP